jgi:hypothetical protein
MMEERLALDDALHALGADENREIESAIGALLRRRASRDDWRECVILQQLESGRNLASWNQLFRRTCEALEDATTLPQKAAIVLNPENRSFDEALDDFVAELLAVQYLAALGHTAIRFELDAAQRSPDLRSVREGTNYATEAKNLREPRSLTYVAFARWHRNRTANPGVFSFSAEFLEIDDPFEDLTADQATAVRELVDHLPERVRPSTFTVTLPGARRARVRVAEGGGQMMRYGPGPFLVPPVVESCEQAVVLKLLEHVRKALTQLYFGGLPEGTRKLLFVRWKPPDEIAAIGEASRVRDSVTSSLQTFLRQFFPDFTLAIMHTYEDLGNVPRATW